MFMGFNMLGTLKSSDNLIEKTQDFDFIHIQNTYIDQLYGTTTVVTDDNWMQQAPETWAFGTAFNATFNDNLQGGNITYSGQSVSKIKIKRKLSTENSQKTIYIKEPDNPELGMTPSEFQLVDSNGSELIDFLEPNNVEVEYMYVPVFKLGTEATKDIDVNSHSIKVKSEFISDMVVGRTNNGEMNGYPARFNETLTTQRNRQTGLVQTMGSKKPYNVINGLSDYYSGSLQANFILLDADCNLDLHQVSDYRKKIDDFLANGESKIIKTIDGQMYMVSLDNTINHNDDGYYCYDDGFFHLMDTSFNWNEIGDAFSIGDLYDNNFINTDIDREDGF